MLAMATTSAESKRRKQQLQQVIDEESAAADGFNYSTENRAAAPKRRMTSMEMHLARENLPQLKEKERRNCRSVFTEMDEDNSGFIDREELSTALRVLTGIKPSKRLLDHMFTGGDLDMDGLISYEEFERLWKIQTKFKAEIAKHAKVNHPFFPPEEGVFKKIFYCFEDPSSSQAGTYLSLFIMAVIILSVISFVMETLPEFKRWSGGAPGRGEFLAHEFFYSFEIFTVIVFSIEYGIRVLLVSFMPPNDENMLLKFFYFVTGPMNMIDLLAIMPFYIELIAGNGDDGSLAALRILRVARVFRVLKLGKYSTGMQMFAVVLKRSREPLLLLMFFLFIAVILFGCLIYFAESGVWSTELNGFVRPDTQGDGIELTPFVSAPSAFWWVIVTTTTVGYGDMYPTSFAGKTIATCCMLLGLLCLALPVSVIGANFSEVYTKANAKALEIEQHLLVKCWSDKIGSDDIHEIDEDEPVSKEEQVKELLAQIDEMSKKAKVLMEELIAENIHVKLHTEKTAPHLLEKIPSNISGFDHIDASTKESPKSPYTVSN